MTEKRTEYHKTYYKANKERINAARKARYQTNKEKEQITHKAYLETHKEQIKATRASPLGRYNALRGKAKTNNHVCTLTLEEYTAIIASDICHYCQFPTNVSTGSALDRIDNSIGYTKENVVLCCRACNVAKSDYFTYEEMVTTIGPAIHKTKERRVTS